ncbi:thiosulfate oxidation carrier complex protein SoxZ [Aquabacterium sp.]|uniref:thiosulfate oxidation carrier complex protein SoxZ n=1 Tax=Aquabacterium sp. TaxID=1872578 RepID=UPI002BAD58F3|nr:thiosulfate oxidation carrier complex protein SoxZ [Aquabacterium sp.]HSW03001.1 thiosulfate oxidation carrier complex protein SoxZ [Aquabacterium sp.]
MARTLIHVPANPKRGEVIELRVTLAHAMETGYRPDAQGQVLPRDIVTQFSCSFDGQPVFSAQLYPAIAANPYLAFSWRVAGSGTLSFSWEGDNGFRQTETVAVRAT